MLEKKVNILLLTLLTLVSTAVSAAVNTQYTATVCGSGSYLFGCETLTSGGPAQNVLGDSTVHLNLLFAAPKATEYTATIEPGQTYLFGCDQYSVDGSTASQTLQQAGCGCDSTVTFKLRVQAPVPAPEDITVSYEAQIKSGETYLFGCNLLTEANSYSRTISRVNGGDSIINLTLSYMTIPGTEPIEVSYTAEINEGEKYLFGCQILDAEGSYTNTLKRTNGADSIVNLTLSFATAPVVEPIEVSYTAEINEGEKYLFGCQILDAEGSYTNTLKRANGADSIVNLTLSFVTVPEPEDITVSYEAEIVGGEIYLFGCNPLTTAGNYTNTLKRENGGDSIINLTLKVLSYGDTIAADCDPIVWYEHTCDATGDYDHTFVGGNIYGGDSIVTLHFTLLQPTYGDTVAAEFAPITWYEHTCDATGDYVHTFIGGNSQGCDSILTLHFTLLTIPETYGDTTAADCDPIVWYEHTCDATGDYDHVFVGGNAAGGDSILTLHFTLLEPTYGDTIAAEKEPITWYEHTCDATNDYVHVFVGGNAAGCDSILTLHFTLLATTYGDTIAAECDVFTWYEHTCAATGDYVHTFVGGNAAGGDSIVTLHFTLLEPTYGDTIASDCAAFAWYEHTCAATGDFVHTFVGGNAAGCDSIVTLHFTLLEPAYGDTTVNDACDSFEWNGTTYTESGDYTFKTTSVVTGCDSIVTLHLTLHKSAEKTADAVTQCYSYYWAYADSTIYDSGTYTHTEPTIHGCDSTVTITVTINSPYVDTLEVRGYYGDRIIMVNRKQINSIPGWTVELDSLDNGEGYVRWYKMSGAAPDTIADRPAVATGYYYTLETGEPLPAGQYYAVVDIPASDGAPCGAQGITEVYPVAGAASAPALMPSLARPGEDIKVINLDPKAETTIRIYSAEGVLQRTFTARDAETFVFRAEYGNGFYLVELSSDSMKSTLRYIVK